MKTRWAIAGAGQISRSIVEDLQRLPDVEIASVFSRNIQNARKFAADYGIPLATDVVENLFDPNVADIAYIATPFGTHRRIAEQALRAGLHVLVEKPIAMCAAEVNELFDIAEQENLLIMEAMWFKFSKPFARVMELIDAGTIGEPKNLRAGFGMPVSHENRSRWDINASGGALLDQGIYPFTLGSALFGVHSHLQVHGEIRPDGIDVTEHVLAQYQPGQSAYLFASMSQFGDLSATIGGTEGWIRMRSPFWACRELEIHAGDLEKLFLNPIVEKLPPEGHGYVPMLEAFTEAFTSGASTVGAHDRKATLRVFEAMDATKACLRQEEI